MDISDKTFNSLPVQVRSRALKGAELYSVILPIVDISASSSREGHEPHAALEDNSNSWIAQDLKPSGESLIVTLKGNHLIDQVGVFFKDEDKRIIEYSIISADGITIFEGLNQPDTVQKTLPVVTDKLIIKTKSYRIKGEGGDSSYPNPGIKNVIVLGLVEDSNGWQKVLAKKKSRQRIAAEATIGYSAINDQEMLSLKDNDVDLSDDRIWVGKGVGSFFAQEFGAGDRIHQLHLQFFQLPPRSYKIFVAVYPLHGITMATLNSSTTIFQRIIDVQKGMDKEIVIPLTDCSSKKTVLISMIDTDSHNRLLTLQKYFVT